MVMLTGEGLCTHDGALREALDRLPGRDPSSALRRARRCLHESIVSVGNCYHDPSEKRPARGPIGCQCSKE